MRKQTETEGYMIQDLIPQRPPIVMIDKFYGIESGCSRTGLTVVSGNIFTEDNLLKEPGIIEHVAQSAAARIGHLCKLNNTPVPIGFIGSIDKMTIYSLPRVGDELRTEIKIIQEVGEITLAGATVKNHDSLIAECRMKIFLKKDETA